MASEFFDNDITWSQKIADLVAFYNETVDIEVDGVARWRPHTRFS